MELKPLDLQLPHQGKIKQILNIQMKRNKFLILKFNNLTFRE